jgi:hypothetical protein
MKISVDKNLLALCSKSGEELEPLLDWILGYVRQDQTKSVTDCLTKISACTARVDIEIDDGTYTQLKKHCGKTCEIGTLADFLMAAGLALGGVE